MKKETIQTTEITDADIRYSIDELLALKCAPAWACGAIVVQGEEIDTLAVTYYESHNDYVLAMCLA